MNKAILVGNLTRDPELSTTPNGISVCRFSIAVNRRFADANGERQTDFLNIVAWRVLADNCGKYIRKGSKVGVVGQIQTRTYEQDGQKKYFTEIIADEVEFLNSKGEAGAPSTGTGNSNTELQPVQDDSLPF